MADKVSGFSFGTNPTGASTVVNPNVPGALDAVLAPANVKGTSSNEAALEYVSPQQLSAIKKDTALQNELEESGKTTTEYIREVQSAMPNSAGKLGDVINSDNSIQDTYKAAKRLKKNVTAGVYNDIESDTMALTTKMSKKLTDGERPMGDYFCRLDGSTLSSISDGTGFSFDLDKAIKSALAGAIAAVGANNKCGFDTVDFIKDSVSSGLIAEGMEQAVAVGVIDEVAAAGTADAVADLATVYGDDMNTSSKIKTASKLAKNYLPDVATSDDDFGAFKDGLTDLVPGFGTKGSDDRKNLMRSMDDKTLDKLALDKDYRSDAVAAKSAKKEVGFIDRMKDQYAKLF